MASVFAMDYQGPVTDGVWKNLDSCKTADLAPSVKELIEIEEYGDGGFHVVEIEL